MVAEVEALLETCAQALAAGDRGGAWQALRDAHVASHAPEIAGALEAMAARFSDRAAVGEKKQTAFVEAWLGLARKRRPWEARWLLAQLEPLARARKGTLVATCLDELVSAPDPTLTALALELCALDGGTVNFGSWGKVLTRLFKLVAGAEDPRAIPPLRALADAARADLSRDVSRDPGRSAEGAVRTPSANQELIERVPKTIAALEKVPVLALTEGARARLAAIEAALAGELLPEARNTAAASPVERAFALVEAAPDDDAARAVWADALSEAGDPRGELVALQLARSPKNEARIKKLVSKHWRAWVGAIAPAIVASSVEIDRGLLVACSTDVRRKAAARAIFDHASWGSLRRLELRGYGLLTSAMRSLEEVTDCKLDALEGLATVELPRLRRLRVREEDYYGGAQAEGVPKVRGLVALSKARGLPALRALELLLAPRELRRNRGYAPRTAADYAWLSATPLATQLETLTLAMSWSTWSASDLAAWRALCGSLARLRVARVEGAGAVLALDCASGELTIEDVAEGLDGAESRRTFEALRSAP